MSNDIFGAAWDIVKNPTRQDKSLDEIRRVFQSLRGEQTPDYLRDQEEAVVVTYREVPEDHPDGEYTWECPYCGDENQEYSGNQSPFSPFRFSGDAEVACAGCGKQVWISEN